MASDLEYQQLLRAIRFELADLITNGNSEDDLYKKVIVMCNSALPEDDQESDPATIYENGYPRIKSATKL